MASKINGTNIVLYYFDTTTSTGVAFGAATSCTFNATIDQTEITASDSGGFKEFKNGQTSWQVTCDGFMSLSADYNYAYLSQLVLNKTPITIKFSIDNDNGDGSHDLGYTIFTGQVNLINLSLTGPAEGVSTYSATLQGTGGFSIDGVAVETSGIAIGSQVVKMFDYTATGGETTITWAGSIGFDCFSVTRGGVEVQDILTSGTPTGDDVKFNTVTGVLTFGTALVAGEFVRALFK
ncbi:MAG: Phage tail tube protein [Bacteroidota bacterium]|jgi:predicted secreted protein